MYWSIFMIVFAFLWWWPCRIVSKKKKIQITIDTPSGADDCFPIIFFLPCLSLLPFYRFTARPAAFRFLPFYRFTVLPRAFRSSDFTVLPFYHFTARLSIFRFYRFTVLPFYRAPASLQILPFYRFTAFLAYICTKDAVTSRPTGSTVGLFLVFPPSPVPGPLAPVPCPPSKDQAWRCVSNGTNPKSWTPHPRKSS